MLVQVYGDNAMKKTAVYEWVKRFPKGRESVTEEEGSGRRFAFDVTLLRLCNSRNSG
jgi:hypothetical protein